MRKVILSLMVCMFLLVGIAESRVYKYKYQFVLEANTDGQTPSSAWVWHNGRQEWKATISSNVMDVEDVRQPIRFIVDSATNACDSTDFDINFVDSIDGSLYPTTSFFYSWDNETKDTIEAMPGGLTPTASYLKITIDEDSGNTCTIDIHVEVTKPY